MRDYEIDAQHRRRLLQLAQEYHDAMQNNKATEALKRLRTLGEEENVEILINLLFDAKRTIEKKDANSMTYFLEQFPKREL